MNNTIFAVFHDAHMINGAIPAPVKEDDVSGHRFIVSVLPLSLRFEPVHSVRAQGKFRDNSRLDVAALLCTLAHKAGAPFHTASKAVPGPVGLSALLPDLRQWQLYDGLIDKANAERTANIRRAHV